MVIRTGNIFQTKCNAITNAVNCVGVMGKGIALEFKKKYPNMYIDYVNRCKLRQVQVGRPYFYTNLDGKKILNFPTKIHWRSPSDISYIIDGLDWFVTHYKEFEISSIAFPALGCGCGGLDWNIVGPLLYQKLHALPIAVELYAPFGTSKEQLTPDFFLSSTYCTNNRNI